MALALGTPVLGAGTYRVEVLVFRHMPSEAEPAAVDKLRGFHDLLDLSEPALPEAPVALDSAGQTFQALWRRLQRLGAYQPLAMLSFEQTQIDYHPPVRLHDDEVVAEELHFPGPVVYVDLDREDLFSDFVLPLYRLDGSVQLRRSRFLHLHFDLEYRIEDPAWEAWEPLSDDTAMSAGNEPLRRETQDTESVSEDRSGERGEMHAPEPFRVHTLNQSRQVRTDTLHYFDTAFLGAIARVTAIEEDDTP
jgi:hypothetical protein